MTTGPRLFLDVQGTQDDINPERGIPRYVGMHARALLSHPDVVSRIALNPSVPARAHLPDEVSESPRVVWNTPGAFRAAHAEGPLAYHVMSPFHLHVPFEAAIPPHAFDAEALVVTLYDLIPLHQPTTYLPTFYGRLYRSRLALVRAADLVLTLSNHTSADAVHQLGLDPARVVTIGAGVSPYFSGCDDPCARDRLCAGVPGLSKPFVMTVTGNDPRKNIGLLIRAFAGLPRSIRRALQVLIVGQASAELQGEYLRVADELGCTRDEIVLSGRVSDATLRALYQAAEVFVFPSVHEGFGLPVLEAVACGCPSLTARASSLPEILEWEPSTFDPTDADGLSALLQRAIVDAPFRTELVRVGAAAASRNTWGAVAERTIAGVGTIDSTASRPSRRRRAPTPLRLAFVGAVSAARETGGKNLQPNLQLVAALRAHCALELYTTGRGPRVDDVPTFPIEAFDRVKTTHGYDCVVYSFGGGAEPSLRALARQAPGLIWLHDARTIARADAGLLAGARAVLVNSNCDRATVEAAMNGQECQVLQLPCAMDNAASSPRDCGLDDVARELVTIARRLPIETGAPG